MGEMQDEHFDPLKTDAATAYTNEIFKSIDGERRPDCRLAWAYEED
jgi:hypothetical protein